MVAMAAPSSTVMADNAQATRKTFPMTVSSWNDFINTASVVLLALTFIAGLAALITGRQVNQRQRTELVRLATELAIAQTGLAQAQEKAARAETETLKLRVAMADRRLTPEQQSLLVAAIKDHVVAGYTVWVRSSLWSDAEVLGGDIVSALKQAGLKTEIRTNAAVASSGITVACGQNEGIDFGRALVNALTKSGLAVAPAA